MNKRLMLTILFLSFSASLFSQVNPDTLPEKYVKKVVIEAKWGNGPGEFGIDTLSDPPVGPSDFCVDANGNIYVVDDINHRVLSFNSYGKYLDEIRYVKEIIADSLAGFWKITVDNKGNLYLLGGKTQPELNGDGEICVYNKRGDLIGKMILPIKSFMLMPVFKPILRYSLVYFGQIIDAIEEFQVMDKEVTLTLRGKIYLLGKINRVKNKGQIYCQKASVRVRQNVYSSSERKILHNIKKAGGDVQILKYTKQGEFFISREMKSDSCSILRFNSSGELLSNIKIPIQLCYDTKRIIFVSEEGTIYYWTNDKRGLKIIKYTREGKNEN